MSGSGDSVAYFVTKCANTMSNWYNLLLTLLCLLLLCFCCVEIGVEHRMYGEFMPVFHQQVFRHSYKIYNQGIATLALTISIGLLMLFFCRRFVKGNTARLSQRQLAFSLLPLLGLLGVLLSNFYLHQEVDYYNQYAIPIGLSLIISVLLVYGARKPSLNHFAQDILDSPKH